MTMKKMIDSRRIVQNALKIKTVVPGFNIPYLPMMEPVVRALADTGTCGLIMVARLEWTKFKSGSLEDICSEYRRLKDERYTRLHLDHVPVIDEDNLEVEYQEIISRAIDLGYDSVMVDASRLPLIENIRCTEKIKGLARKSGVAVEGELGAVMGHETGPLPPYEELFASGKGFTDVKEAETFVRETGVDWLSVAAGNIHGAITAAKRSQTKVEAKLDVERIGEISRVVKIPLVLHGGTGIKNEYIRESVRRGIAKINIATAIRQPYEKAVSVSVAHAQEEVYKTVLKIIRDELEIAGSAKLLGLS